MPSSPPDTLNFDSRGIGFGGNGSLDADVAGHVHFLPLVSRMPTKLAQYPLPLRWL